MTAQNLTWRLLSALGLSVVFSVASVAALVLHLDLPLGRRVLTEVLRERLNALFEGSFHIGHIERAGRSGVSAENIVVRDPQGRIVLSLARLRAQADVVELARRYLFGGRKITLVIEHVHVTRAEVYLFADERTGVPSVAAAFTPRQGGEELLTPSTPRDVRVALQAVEITRVFARGTVYGLPTLEADLSGARGWLRATPAGVELGVSRFSTQLRGLGGADVRGITSLRLRQPGGMWLSFDGYFGDVQVASILRVDGSFVQTTLDLPRARPAELRALWPSYPLQEDASLHLEGIGELPRLQVSAELRAGTARLSANGPLELSGQPRATLEVEGKAVDLRLALAGAPLTQLDFWSTLRVVLGEKGPELSLQATTQPTEVSGVELPQVDWAATYLDRWLRGHALLHEPGVPTRMTFELDPQGSLALRASSAPFRLERAPRLAQWLDASGQAELQVQAGLEGPDLSAEFRADVRDLRVGSAALGSGTLRGRAHGKLAELKSLRFDAELKGERLSAGSFDFEEVSASANGSLARPTIKTQLRNAQGPSVSASAQVEAHAGAARVSDLRLEIQHEDSRVSGSLARLEITEHGFEVRTIELSGLGGKLTGSAQFRPDLLAFEARGENLDVRALSRLLGLPSHSAAGKLALIADVVLARDLERGDVQLDWQDGTLGPLSGVTLAARAHLEDRRLQTSAELKVDELGSADAELDAKLTGSALAAKSWQELLGEARLRVHDVDLTLLGRALAPGGQLDALRGTVSSEARLSRREPRALPSVALVGYTKSLTFDLPKPDLANEKPAPSKRLTGLDARWGVDLNGETGDSNVTLRLVDSDGQLASASVSTRIDLARALRAPEQLGAQLWNQPAVARLLVEDRPLNRWPAALQPQGIDGRLRAEASFMGSLAKPELSARVYLGEFGVSSARQERPIDLCASAAWQQQSGRLASSGEAFLSKPQQARCSGARIAQYSLNGNLEFADARLKSLRGGATASLEGFPLDAIPWLGDAEVAGRASGKLSLTHDAEVPTIAANLDLRRVRVRNVVIGSGKLEVRSSERAIGATLRLAHEGGQLQATALAALDSGQLIPRLDPREPIRARVTAERVDAVVLAPFVTSVFTDLGGRIDGDVNAALTPRPRTDEVDAGYAGTLQGQLSLRDGTLQLAGLGLRLNEVQLVARAEGAGPETRITFDELRARAGRRRERVSVRQGRLWLEGLSMSRAEGTVDATELPLLLEGVSQATATTRQGIAFRIQRTPQQMEANFQVPYLSVVLPQSSARDVLPLDENRSIEVLQPLGEPRQRDGEALPWLLRFELGPNVKITRSDLDLPLTGTAQVRLAEQVSVGGDLELMPGGRIEVSGKTFVIDSGELHFDTGDTGNPRILVRASWRAPDGTTIVADVSGTLKAARLRLTSDPARTEVEIYALLLGGSGSGEGGDARAAGAGVGADAVLAPLLVNTPLSRVEFRAGNEQISESRSYSTYTAAVPIGDEVWFEGSYKSDNSGDEQREAFSGTVDWRFRRNWSLRTEVGTIGTGIDLLWQYRY